MGAAVAAILVAGCARHSATAPSGAGYLTLKAGEHGEVNGIAVTMVRVDADSRCPSDVQCVSAGNAVVAFTLRTPSDPLGSGTAALQFLNTTVEPRSLVRAGYRITLDSLTPYPVSTHTIAPDEYRAFFSVAFLPD